MRSQFQPRTLRQQVEQNSFFCKDLLRILGPHWPSKGSAPSTGPGTARENVLIHHSGEIPKKLVFQRP